MAGAAGRRIDAMADPQVQLLAIALLIAVGVAMLALLVRVRRERHEREDASADSPIAMSSEGMKLCPSCATENLWTDSTCVACGRRLRDAPRRTW